MPIKTVLACVSSAEASATTLELAWRVASMWGAHVEALHVRADPRALVPYTGEGMDGSMIEEIMEVTEKEGGERAESARAMFDGFCGAHGVTVTDTPTPDGPTASWREETGREDEIVAVRGRLFDIVVVGRALRDSPLPSPITLEAALLDTGRSIFVAPPTLPEVTGKYIAVAWETSPEAARTIGQSISLMGQAEKVTLLYGEPAAPPHIPPEEGVTRLAWSGVKAEIKRFNAKEEEIGAAYLKHAGEVGADMLVKGAYSQSRLRQMILGGRTRHILAHTTIPVFLAH
jgi:nucleotide-binding universal stress UspA family protein